MTLTPRSAGSRSAVIGPFERTPLRPSRVFGAHALSPDGGGRPR
ncbi:hypothetical protein [Actinomadura roseirufa]|nr:hypothetical protein [Actinomadura roseirufa]